MNSHNSQYTASDFQICFNDLFGGGHSLAFPCDAQGRVDIDALSERARVDYLFARAMVGRDYAPPAIEPPARPH